MRLVLLESVRRAALDEELIARAAARRRQTPFTLSTVLFNYRRFVNPSDKNTKSSGSPNWKVGKPELFVLTGLIKAAI